MSHWAQEIIIRQSNVQCDPHQEGGGGGGGHPCGGHPLQVHGACPHRCRGQDLHLVTGHTDQVSGAGKCLSVLNECLPYRVQNESFSMTSFHLKSGFILNSWAVEFMVMHKIWCSYFNFCSIILPYAGPLIREWLHCHHLKVPGRTNQRSGWQKS